MGRRTKDSETPRINGRRGKKCLKFLILCKECLFSLYVDDFQLNEQGNEGERWPIILWLGSDLCASAVKFQLSRLTVTMSGRGIEGLKRHSKFDPGSRAALCMTT